jgi:hypothetical protein
MTMGPLDGNAIAGDLFEYFGVEMTTASGICAHCGTRSVIAELRVYRRAPGAVVRCRSCGNVVTVLATIHGTTHVHLTGLRLADPVPEPLPLPLPPQ